MTQEEKQLLLKDLSARLPYDPFIKIGENPHAFKLSQRVRWIYSYGRVENMFDNTKPYLRPMSSMTEEECKEVGEHITIYDTVDWMNEHHFDYRGLIPMGLAIEAPEGMYK